MAINAWWVPEPDQRFWMEATDRSDLGSALRAPKGGTAGQPVWNYDLVAYTQPGDVIFHWHTTRENRPGIVGWSTVVGPLAERDYAWAPKAGPGKDTPTTRPHWVMPLGGLHLLDHPVTIDDVSTIRNQILGVRAGLEARIDGSSYFPFNKYREDDLRAMQGYFTKFPRELVNTISSHFDLELTGAEGIGLDGDHTLEIAPKAGGQGVIADTARRQAIERHAVQRAIDFYASIGATDIHELGKPYDLRLALDGREVHVEVKGSSLSAASVIVTRNEVAHAAMFERIELFVVDEVSVRWQDDTLVAVGGRARRWTDWAPGEETLKARTFDHTLGEGFVILD